MDRKSLLLTGLCIIGATLALPAVADDDRRGRRDDRHEHHDRGRDNRYVDWYERRDDRGNRRHERRGQNDRYVYVEPRSYRRVVPSRHVAQGRYCNDRRHYRDVHYHVAPRDYYSYDYPRDSYRLRGRSGLDATLILTLPLF